MAGEKEILSLKEKSKKPRRSRDNEEVEAFLLNEMKREIMKSEKGSSEKEVFLWCGK